MKNHLRYFIWFLAYLFCDATGWLGAGPMEDWSKMSGITPQGYVCYHTTDPVKIDGQLNEAAWQAVPWTENFTDIEGAARPKPPAAPATPPKAQSDRSPPRCGCCRLRGV